MVILGESATSSADVKKKKPTKNLVTSSLRERVQSSAAWLISVSAFTTLIQVSEC